MELKSCSFVFFKLVGSEGLKRRVKRNNSAFSLHLASLYLHFFPCYAFIELFHGPLIYNLLSKWIESFLFLQGKERTMLLLFVCVSPLISLWVNGSQWKIASPPLTGVFLGCTKMDFEAEPALDDPFSLGTTYVLLCRQSSMSFSLPCETVMNISLLF